MWRNNIIGQSHHGKAYSSWDKWLFVPDTIKEDKYQREYVQGFLRRSDSLEFIRETAVKMKVYDKLFIKTIKNLWQGKTSGDEDLIPEDILMIEHARMCYHEFPFPLFNKQENKKISGISIFTIAKEVDGDNVVFYEGWDPQERGKKIEEEFFTRAL